MKKLGLLLIACFAFAAFASAQNNIVKSLERNVPGQGKVTIHQDARIEALIGQEYIPNGTENRVLKSQVFVYRCMPETIPVEPRTKLTLWAHESKNISRNFLFIPLSTLPAGCAV